MKSTQTKILGLALLIVGLALCGLGLSLLLRPPQYQATARIKVESDTIMPGGSGASVDFDPYFIQTTFEIIQSQIVLSNAIAALNLQDVWDKKFADGRKLTLSEMLARLKRQLVLAPVRNTKLISITFYSDDPKEAADVANAIAQSYQDYRVQTWRQETVAGLKVLEREYQDKEKQIETLQTNLEELRKQFGIDDSTNSNLVSDFGGGDELRPLIQQLIEDERDYLQSSNQLHDLKADDVKKLRTDLPAVSHDQTLMDLLKKLSETEQAYESLTNNYLPTNAEVIQTKASLNILNQQIDDRIAGLMAGLENKLKSEQAALDSIHEEFEEAKAKGLADATKKQPYYDAKIKLDQLLDQQRLFKAKIEAQKIDQTIPKAATVQIIDPAEPPKFPIGRNHFVGGALLAVGFILALGGIFLFKPEN